MSEKQRVQWLIQERARLSAELAAFGINLFDRFTPRIADKPPLRTFQPSALSGVLWVGSKRYAASAVLCNIFGLRTIYGHRTEEFNESGYEKTLFVLDEDEKNRLKQLTGDLFSFLDGLPDNDKSLAELRKEL